MGNVVIKYEDNVDKAKTIEQFRRIMDMISELPCLHCGAVGNMEIIYTGGGSYDIFCHECNGHWEEEKKIKEKEE